MLHAPRQILVRAPNWLGDLVMSTPGFRALREGFPKARLHLQVRSELAPIIDGAPWFDEVHPFSESQRRGMGAWRHGRELAHQHRFDLGLCIPDSFSSAALMRLAGVQHLVGYRRGGRSALLHQPVTPPVSWGRRGFVAREQFVLDLARNVGCRERGTKLELFTTDAEQARARQALGAQGVSLAEEEPFVLLVPGASYGPSKCWPVSRFAEVGDRLFRAGAKLLIVGSPAERSLAERVRMAMQSPAFNLAGRLDLGALKVIVRRAKAVVCNDAGLRHVAVAFGVPCVVVMGPTSLRKTGMNLETVRVVESEVACRPCYRRSCPIDHRCMTRLQTGDVLEALGGLTTLLAPSSEAS